MPEADGNNPDRTRVTSITVARLYNLGNYEHVRYEVTAVVGPEDKASEVFANLDAVMLAMNPNHKVSLGEIIHANNVLSETPDDTDENKLRRKGAQHVLNRVKRATERRAEALEVFNDLGGATVFSYPGANELLNDVRIQR